jgi:hypothetical protein
MRPVAKGDGESLKRMAEPAHLAALDDGLIHSARSGGVFGASPCVAGIHVPADHGLFAALFSHVLGKDAGFSRGLEIMAAERTGHAASPSASSGS